ncbi:unnamed protein product, partial [Polarella glacialis]
MARILNLLRLLLTADQSSQHSFAEFFQQLQVHYTALIATISDVFEAEEIEWPVQQGLQLVQQKVGMILHYLQQKQNHWSDLM